MHGWIDLHERSPREDYLEAAVRGGEFLRRNQDDDGAWRGEAEYFRIPHTYCSRVSWALLRLAEATGDDAYREAAHAPARLGACGCRRRPDGSSRAQFEPGKLPNTHGIAYTLRGLLESYALTDNEPYLEAVRRTSERDRRQARRAPDALLPATLRRCVDADGSLRVPHRHGAARRRLAAAATS